MSDERELGMADFLGEGQDPRFLRREGSRDYDGMETDEEYRNRITPIVRIVRSWDEAKEPSRTLLAVREQFNYRPIVYSEEPRRFYHFTKRMIRQVNRWLQKPEVWRTGWQRQWERIRRKNERQG